MEFEGAVKSSLNSLGNSFSNFSMPTIPIPSVGQKEKDPSKEVSSNPDAPTSSSPPQQVVRKDIIDDEKAYQLTRSLYDTLSAPSVLSYDVYSLGNMFPFIFFFFFISFY